MKIAACQFAVSGDVRRNLYTITKYVRLAADQSAKLAVFPECALTGYPPLNIPSAASADFSALAEAHAALQQLSDENGISILTGTITRCEGSFHNSAILFSPDKLPVSYHKRALWGWDRENFVPGSESGIFQIDGLRIGVRICYEVRFPEYFRELYREKTDLNIVLFHDTCASENSERYELIKAHLRTRAAENVTSLLSCNTCVLHQTAPTAFFSASGEILSELLPDCDGLLLYDFHLKPLDFSETGRRSFSDALQQTNHAEPVE